MSIRLVISIAALTMVITAIAATWTNSLQAEFAIASTPQMSHRVDLALGDNDSTRLPDGLFLQIQNGTITGVIRDHDVSNESVWSDLLGTRYATGDLDRTDVTRQLWRFVEMEMRKADGSQVELQLARPLWWIEHHEVQVGATVQIDLEEMGIVGDATVLKIGPCTADSRENMDGSDLVIGTFKHHNAVVWDLYFEGLDKALGVTSNHPIFSEDRQDWVSAGDLRGGELIRTIHGPTRLLDKTQRSERETVYNLEIHRSHAFHVTDLGILVHNSCLANNLRNTGSYGDIGTDAHHIVALSHRGARPAREVLRKHGIDINDAMNGVWLPRNSSVSRARGALHHEAGSALTNGRYIDEINRRILAADAAGGRGRVLRELQKIRHDLLNGTFPGVRPNF